MAFLSNIFKKDQHQVSSDVQNIASGLSSTFTDGTVKLAHGISQKFSEISELVKWTTRFVDEDEQPHTLHKEIKDCLSTAVKAQETMNQAIEQKAFSTPFLRTFAKDRADRQVTVLEKLADFVETNQSTIERLQRRKTDDPKGFSKDIEELSKTARKEVVAVIEYLAGGHFEAPKLSVDDFELMHANLDSSDVQQVVQSKATLSSVDVKQMEQRPLMNAVTIEDVHPL
ncbi:MAG: hypothetical protein JSR39_05970 [Verrucomicrobia bacterium]|nr:hypothetical protein [Verrucomicrobiota bacterium]